MKRFLTILFTALLLTAALCVTASASAFDDVAEDLSAIGMFRGTANGFELDRAPTRSEAAIMLVRLYGAEDAAKAAYEAGEIKHPFTDVSDFASPYVAWVYTNGIANGTTAATFGSANQCSARNYVVFLLRALGYKDGVDFQYADALDFAATRGLMDASFYSGEFLRDDLAAVTYQALACSLADGSTYLLDSLVKSGAIDAKAAQPIINKIEAYQVLSASAMGAVNDSLDADIAMKMDMAMNISGSFGAESMDMDADIAVDARGSIQMALADALKMGLQLDMDMDIAMKDFDGQEMTMSQPGSMGMWIKDNWVYVQQNGTCYKQDLGGSVSELLAMYQEVMSQMSGASAAMMMPYIDEITAAAVTANPGGTLYTLTLNEEAYKGLMDDILDIVFLSLGEEAGLSLDMDLDLSDCTYTYALDSKGQLKNMAAAMKMTMKMNMTEAGETSAVTVTADVDMTMKVNATGSGVKVSYPDLSQFPDIAAVQPAPDALTSA